MKRLNGILLLALIAFYACNDAPAPSEPTSAAGDTTVSTASSTAARDYELGDTKFADMAAKDMDNLAKGNIDAFAESFADNAVYRWNNYDSIAGKPAIVAYWKKRWADVLDSLAFSNQIILPIHVTRPMSTNQVTGNYALVWHVTHAKYKTGKSIKQRMHTVYHYNDNGKIDFVSSYMDRAQINAALAK